MYIYTCTIMHTYTHTYMHTYIHTYTYKHTCTYIHTYIHTYIITSICHVTSCSAKRYTVIHTKYGVPVFKAHAAGWPKDALTK